MKQAYAVILLTTIIASTSCMEKERRQFHNNCEGIFPAVNPSNIIPVYITTIRPTMPVHTTYTYQPLSQHVVAHEPSWQQLDKIADIPYKRDQKNTKNEVELTPIYYPTTVNTNYTATTQQTQLSLRTLTPVQPNADLMQKLYRDAHGAIWSTSTLPNKTLTDFIASMNNARIHGINEDIMGKFAYSEYNWFGDNVTPRDYLPLLFSCLKQYRLTVSTTKELLPPNQSSIDNYNLAKTLGLANTKPIVSTQNPNAQIETSIQQTNEPYPAYHKLAVSLATLLKQNIYQVKEASCYLYSEDESTLRKDPSSSLFALHLNDFYDKAYYLMTQGYLSSVSLTNLDRIYDLLQTAELAKFQKKFTQEKELGYAMFTHGPIGPTNFFNFLNYIFESSDFANDTTNRICLLCTLLEKYNKPNKLTPTPKQYMCYQLQKKLDFALPNSFAKSNLFDEEEYAFTEFKQLLEDIMLLKKSDKEKVHECIIQLYPLRK